VERYEKVGRSIDPVLQYVLNNHAPAHEELVLPVGTWKKRPIVGCGQLISTIHFARVGDTSSFNFGDLVKLGAVCTHMSACLAGLRQQPLMPPNNFSKRLTPRELQIANLVSKGMTNAEIGTQLWITPNSVNQALKRMFRKLEVSNRTEMAAKLQDTHQNINKSLVGLRISTKKAHRER
jgi:DNA-binding CsgD family transcriptional regulator